MQHGDIWRGIDLLAQSNGLSTSGLAKLAGLDATAFNKSKRLPKDGRPRWPSTESISRVLNAVGVEFDDFARLVSGRHGPDLPLIRQSDLDLLGKGEPAGARILETQDSVHWPSDESDNAWFVLEIDRRDLMPVYETGDRLIVARHAPLRIGRRIIVKPSGQPALIGTLIRTTDQVLEVQAFAGRRETHAFAMAELDWVSRILWASQ